MPARTVTTIKAPETPLRIIQTGGPLGLTLAGEIDPASHRQLRSAIASALRADGQQIVVDLAAVTYCDVAGLRVIVQLALDASSQDGQAGCSLAVVLPDYLCKILVILGWDQTPGLVLLGADGPGRPGPP